MILHFPLDGSLMRTLFEIGNNFSLQEGRIFIKQIGSVHCYWQEQWNCNELSHYAITKNDFFLFF